MTQAEAPQIPVLKKDYGFKPGLRTVNSTGPRTLLHYSPAHSGIKPTIQYSDSVQFSSLPIYSTSDMGVKLQFSDQLKIKKEVVTLMKREGGERLTLNTRGGVTSTEWGPRDTNNNGGQKG